MVLNQVPEILSLTRIQLKRWGVKIWPKTFNLSFGLFQENLLQSSGPGPLESDGISVEEVLNIISQSIYREGEGSKPFDWKLAPRHSVDRHFFERTLLG